MMDWLKKNYEKAAAIAAGVLALASGVLVILSVSSFPLQFEGRDSTKPRDNTVPDPPFAPVDQAAAVTSKPRIWGVYEGSLLVSRPYVLKDGALVDPLEGGQPLHPPVPNAWLIQNNLDYADSGILGQDPDNDGFTNLEEFLAGTDPSAKTSTPPYYTKLRLQKFIATPFRLRFTGTPDEGQTFTINSKDLKSRTQFLQLGDMIEGSPYKILAYEKKSEVRDEIERDVSELTIENTETGQKIVLVVGKEANDPTSFAEFVYLLDNSKFTVKKDDTFSLEPEKDRKYKLIDITETEALIQDTVGGDQFKIPKLNK
ncbi:MAG: hypothetical protein Fur0032_10450 [Terrimicrobiaceae bacterium]